MIYGRKPITRDTAGLAAVFMFTRLAASSVSIAASQPDEASMRQLTEHNPHAAAEAFSAIACHRAVGDEVRQTAAEPLVTTGP